MVERVHGFCDEKHDRKEQKAAHAARNARRPQAGGTARAIRRIAQTGSSTATAQSASISMSCMPEK